MTIQKEGKTMGKLNLFQEIVRVAYGKPIPVFFRNFDYCQTKNQIMVIPWGPLQGRIAQSIPLNIIVGNQNTWDRIFDFLLPEQKEIWKNHHPQLFSVLHEIGHCMTHRGLNYNKMQKEYAQVQRLASFSPYLANDQYRKIESEKLSDEWATEWVKNNPELAEKFSKELQKYYK